MPNNQSVNHTVAQQLQALSLAKAGIAMSIIKAVTEIKSESTIYRYKKQARDRGYDPTVSRVMKMEYVVDAPRSGRPVKVTPKIEQAILDNVRSSRNGRNKPTWVLGSEHSLSPSTILNVLHRNKMRPCKETKKPGLDKSMMEARYQFCLRYEHWTIEDWKNVIWTDETSVVLHTRWGFKNRIWRTPGERYVKTCIRRRWKKYAEFMFWGCYLYDKKGPFHIWRPETVAERKAAQEDLDRLNQEREAQTKEDWELETAMRRMGLRNPRGRKPTWKFTEKTGKVTRDSRGGVDWYRYQKKVLLPKLIPFAKECQIKRPDTIVQEDKAPGHASKHQHKVFMDFGVLRLLWPGNSPDLNMIEPCWPWMKRDTTRKGAPRSRKEAEKRWAKCWKDLPQSQIQAWINRIERHIKEVIRLEGGNEYREGQDGGDIRPYDSDERRRRYQVNKLPTEDSNSDVD